MSKYLVIGKQAYRKHDPGTEFVADLPADVERRAIEAGAIKLLERSVTRLELSKTTMPRGW